MQHILLLFTVIGLLVATNVQAALHGNVTLMVLAATVAVQEDLARVFTNLVTNACHALADRARASGDDYEPDLRIGSRRTAEGAAITIRDNGVGMSPEVMSRIFSPFFTTKEGNRSTGLGLTLSHEIVREHGGQILPASQPGEYTVMTVHLLRDPREPGHASDRRSSGGDGNAAVR